MKFKNDPARLHLISTAWFTLPPLLILASIANAQSTGAIRLDAKLPQVSADSGFEVFEVCRAARISCGIEEDVLHRIPQNKGILKSTSTLRSSLNAITSRYGHYHWVIRDNVVNIEPINRSGTDPLSATIDHIRIQGANSMSGATMVLRQAKIEAYVNYFGRPKYAQVTIDLTNVTVREALNAIAKEDGQVTWFFRPANSPTGHAVFDLSTWRMNNGTTR